MSVADPWKTKVLNACEVIGPAEVEWDANKLDDSWDSCVIKSVQEASICIEHPKHENSRQQELDVSS